jgi:hypothetical protein
MSLLALVVALAAQAEPAPDDDFIAGYATAVLERDFDARVRVDVRDGVIRLPPGTLKPRDRDRAAAALSRIPGVQRVEFLPASEGAPEPPIPAGGWTIFPEERLFEPLLADPRWPHFEVSYAHYHESAFPHLVNAAQIALGEDFMVVAYDAGEAGKMDVGLEPAVFGLFNLDALSHDLVNADYRIGLPADYRNGGFSARTSLYHQSSHLGDEFLLDTPVQRINLSYEAVQLRLSYERGAFRIFAGAERIVHTDTPLSPWSTEQGAEYLAPASVLSESVRPLVALYIREREETGWRPSVSARAGLQLLSPEGSRRRIAVFLEYYRGDDPNGQFQAERIETYGVGLHVFF